MTARSKARKRALDVLYESELRGLGTGGSLADRLADADPPVAQFTVDLVEGVSEHIETIVGQAELVDVFSKQPLFKCTDMSWSVLPLCVRSIRAP